MPIRSLSSRLVAILAMLLLASCQQENNGEFSFSLPGGGMVTGGRNTASTAQADGTATTTVTPASRAAPGAVSYVAFTAKHGPASEVMLSADGSHFISRHGGFPGEVEAEIRYWRIHGTDAELVADLPLPGSGKGYSLDTRAAISADGGMVALTSRSADAAGQFATRQVALYVVAGNTHRRVEIGSYGVPNSDACNMAFLDADTLAVCVMNTGGGSSIFLVRGLNGRSPAPVPGSVFRADQQNLGWTLSIKAKPGSKHVYGIVTKGKYNVFGLEYQDNKPVLTFRGFPADRLTSVRQQGTQNKDLSDIVAHVERLSDGQLFVGSSGHVEIWRQGSSRPSSIIRNDALQMPSDLKSLSPDGRFILARRGQLYQLEGAAIIGVANAPGLDAAYNANTREIIAVGGTAISRMTVSPQRLSAVRAYADGLAMVEAGFDQAGFEKIRQSATLDPTYWVGQAKPDSDYLALSASQGKIKASLAEVGRTLLHFIKVMDGMEKLGVLPLGGTQERDGKVVIPRHDRSCRDSNPLLEAGAQDGDHIVMVNGRTITSRKEYLDIVTAMPGDTEVELVLAAPDGSRRNPARIKTVALPTLNPMGYIGIDLTIYGLLAVQAGHPGIALQVESRLRRMVADRQLCLAALSWANLLGGLARAANGNTEDGYNYILANGGLDAHGGAATGVRYGSIFSRAAAPLYRDKAKIAFLLKKKPDEVSGYLDYKETPQPYPDLNGNLIQPSGVATPASTNPGPIMPAVERAQQGAAPEAVSRPPANRPPVNRPATSGGGVVLD